MKPLLICLDLQEAFVRSTELATPNAARALLEIRHALAIARRRNWSVAHCRLQRRHAPLFVSDDLARPIAGFEPRACEHVLERSALSAYDHPQFDGLMERAQEAGVVVVSLSASITLLATALDAFDRGHRLYAHATALAAQFGAHASCLQHESVALDVLDALGFVCGEAEGPLAQDGPVLAASRAR